MCYALGQAQDLETFPLLETPPLASTRPKKGNGEEGAVGKGETKEKAEPTRTSEMRARRETGPHYLGRS